MDTQPKPTPLSENDQESPRNGNSARMVAAHCPYCGTAVAVDSSLDQHRQHCHACGRRMRKLHKKKRHRAADLTAEGLMSERSRERVWMPIAGIALAVVFAAIFAIWMIWHPKSKTAAPVAAAVPESETLGLLMERFMAARTEVELRPLIRSPETFAPAVRAWIEKHPGALPLGGHMVRAVTKEAGGSRLAEVMVRYDDRPRANLLCVSTTDGWKVDWRAFSGEGDLSVADFVRDKPASPVLLLTVAVASDYYNGPYADPAEWLCLHLADETGDHTLYAYAKRSDGALMEKLARMELPRSRQRTELRRVSRSLSVRLHVPGREPPSPLQAEIDAVEGEGWFVP